MDVPYADVIPVVDEQIVQEANPLAVFSHWTALAHNGLTDQIPTEIQATHCKPPAISRVPLGTAPEEWVGLDLPPLARPPKVGDVAVRWFQTLGKWDFGRTISYTQGLPIYVTDNERTLLDVLRSPDEAGGILTVFRSWRRARDVLNLDRVIDYTERFDQPIFRQRVGFVLEEVGFTHLTLAAWKTNLLRGGSLKLVPSLPYSPEFSPHWNISLNVPASVIQELKDRPD